MDTPQNPGSNAEIDQRDLAWEADRITEANADFDAGLYATSEEVRAWIESIGTDNELPAPIPA